MIKKIIVTHKLSLIGLIFGAVAGWLYWYFIGCSSGTCPISSNPTISTFYGALMGWLLVSSFKKDKKN
jgi:hypothetical protein